MSAAGNWELLPGQTTTREWLRVRYGGNVQGGIANVADHPLIWVFAGRAGAEHGYRDRVIDDDLFEYTGQGQIGDQTFTRNNLALRDHKALGKAVHVFADFDERLCYVGEFGLADDQPYKWATAPSTDNGPLRKVIVFRLQPLAADLDLLRALHAQPPKGRDRTHWSGAEYDALVNAYMLMLKHRIEMRSYSDSEVLQNLRSRLAHRDIRSIYSELGGVSGILKDKGYGWMVEYVPNPEYKADLSAIVTEHFGPGHEVSDLLQSYENSTLPNPSDGPPALKDVLVPTPSHKGPGSPKSSTGLAGGHLQAMNAFRNKELGTNGERWVRDLEVRELTRLGFPKLAKRVEWIAERDDTAGFDVLSFRPEGTEHFIEVKTTNLSDETPFFITKHEVEVSDQHATKYSLYRVHGFRTDPRVYILPGSVRESAELEPSVFTGYPRA